MPDVAGFTLRELTELRGLVTSRQIDKRGSPADLTRTSEGTDRNWHFK